ncbi:MULTISPECIES: hypothetical protein [Nocardia]|nr:MULTISPECIES: hypothetical protein [Nocardia]
MSTAAVLGIGAIVTAVGAVLDFVTLPLLGLSVGSALGSLALLG